CHRSRRSTTGPGRVHGCGTRHPLRRVGEASAARNLWAVWGAPWGDRFLDGTLLSVISGGAANFRHLSPAQLRQGGMPLQPHVGIKEELQLGPRAELTKVCQNLRKPGKNPLFGELPRGIRVSLLARLDRQETTRCSHPLYFLQSDAQQVTDLQSSERP